MKKLPVWKICAAAGIVLIAAALGFLLVRQYTIGENARKSAGYAETIRTLIPEPQAAMLEERQDNAMPLLCIDGTDFAALLEFPAFNVAFPVGAAWQGGAAYPCRYAGSIYDRSLVIGSTNARGQLDFVKELRVGDDLWLTDMVGDCYAYEIADIQYRAHADNETIYADTSALTVFVKNMYAFEYIMLRCEAKGA